MTDPTGSASGSFRVLRGGNWLDFTDVCRVSGRYGSDPTSSDCGIGFRCVRRQELQVPKLKSRKAERESRGGNLEHWSCVGFCWMCLSHPNRKPHWPALDELRAPLLRRPRMGRSGREEPNYKRNFTPPARRFDEDGQSAYS